MASNNMKSNNKESSPSPDWRVKPPLDPGNPKDLEIKSDKKESSPSPDWRVKPPLDPGDDDSAYVTDEQNRRNPVRQPGDTLDAGVHASSIHENRAEDEPSMKNDQPTDATEEETEKPLIPLETAQSTGLLFADENEAGNYQVNKQNKKDYQKEYYYFTKNFDKSAGILKSTGLRCSAKHLNEVLPAVGSGSVEEGDGRHRDKKKKSVNVKQRERTGPTRFYDDIGYPTQEEGPRRHGVEVEIEVLPYPVQEEMMDATVL